MIQVHASFVFEKALCTYIDIATRHCSHRTKCGIERRADPEDTSPSP